MYAESGKVNSLFAMYEALVPFQTNVKGNVYMLF